jgi:glycine betaine catabolism A
MQSKAARSHRELLDARQAGCGMAGELYGREDVFQNDLEIFFHKHWIMAGVAADLRKAGDMSVVDIGPASIMLVHGEDDVIRASRSDRGRQPVHVREIGGLIFVCLADEAPKDIDRLEEVMLPRLAPFELGHTKIAFEQDIVEAGNWKLVIENNRECYHCSAGHPELIVTLSAADFGYAVDELSEQERSEFQAHEQYCERKLASWDADGLPHAIVDEMDGDTPTMFRAQRLVIAGAGESQTMTTRVASTKLLGKGGRRDQGSTHLWTHSAWVHVMSDHAVITYCIPLTPDSTLVRSKWLVHSDAVEGVDYRLSELTEVWTATNAADARFVGITQLGTQDPGYLPGPYSTYMEGYVEKFAQWYSTRLGAHGI